MNALPLRFFSLALLGTTALSLAACGGASEAKAPAAQQGPEPEPMSIEEAQDQISRARERLASASTGAPPEKSAGAPAADASRPAEAAPPPPPPKTLDAESSSRRATGKAGPAVEDGRCSSPCRALASMRRAVTALCRMAGDNDNRCLDARRTLADSEGRISPCSC